MLESNALPNPIKEAWRRREWVGPERLGWEMTGIASSVEGGQPSRVNSV
jgi:hypothetical protein